MFIQVYVLFVFLAGKFADIGIHMDGNQQVREYESATEKKKKEKKQYVHESGRFGNNRERIQ